MSATVGKPRAVMLGAETGIVVLRESRVYETEPVGDVDQGAFLNMAVAVETTLAPLEFLDRAQAIESRHGRVPTRRWGPRMIDIDIVLWNDMVMETERLTIPHPEFRKRAFVLVPLAEIAPDAVDPSTNGSNALRTSHPVAASNFLLPRPEIPNPSPLPPPEC